MRRSSRAARWIGCGFGVAALGLGAIGRASVTVDGTLGPSEGYNLETLQTINTGFGDSNYTGSPNGPDANGSEMDAAYAVVSGGNLNIFLAGDYENNGNHVNVFIADGRPGQNVLNASVGPINSMNGSVFSAGFNATYVIDTNDYQGTAYTDVDDLTGATYTGYAGAVGLTAGIGNGALSNGILLGLNNSNISTMGAAGAPANMAGDLAVNTGLEFAIPLGLLGNPTGPIMVLADINGGGDGYLSNQFLPGLPPGTGNLGGGGPFTGPNGGTFNFSNTPGEYFTVAVPEPASLSLVGGAIMMLFARRRKA